jgi:hypothetical protein
LWEISNGCGQLDEEVGRREGEFIGEHSPVYNVGGDQQRSDSNRGALNLYVQDQDH